MSSLRVNVFLVGATIAATFLALACGAKPPAESPSSPSAPPRPAVLTAMELNAPASSKDGNAPRNGRELSREPPIDRAAPQDRWRERYPQAADALDEWLTMYPAAATRFCAWSADEPEQLDVLIMWAVTSPHESFKSFLAGRSSWRLLATLEREHPQALAAFLHWVRRARPAAEELAVRPGSLAFVARRAARR